jgi:hypothetical protein
MERIDRLGAIEVLGRHVVLAERRGAEIDESVDEFVVAEPAIGGLHSVLQSLKLHTRLKRDAWCKSPNLSRTREIALPG